MSNQISAGEDDADVALDDTDSLPPLAAAFLILFDLKVGYSIAWKRTLPEIELDGAVEYKSLPSGLHNVKEDLIYFTHGDYAGISAFVSGAAAESERNARLVAVGILVPLSSGRLGQSWLHTQHLQDLATHIAKNTTDTKPLEEYWNKHHPDGRPVSGLDKRRESLGLTAYSNGSLAQRKSGAFSSAAGLLQSEQSLHPSHPARSILRFLDTFGPLSFPLYRAALLRKRVLIIAEPPVRESCNFVYDLSIISTIPSSAADVIFSNPAVKDPPLRFRALFSVGVHDIPQLSATATPPPQQQGWVACSTDEVLALKTQLYDIVVELPPGYASPSSNPDQPKRWPTIKTSTQKLVKATQRDLRRYHTLRHELHTLTHYPAPTAHRSTQPQQDNSLTNVHDSSTTEANPLTDDTAPLLPSEPPPSSSNETSDSEDDTLTAPITEPRTWSALAYASFLWWASAGERGCSSSPEEDEATQDRALFARSLGASASASASGPGLGSLRRRRSERRGSSRPMEAVRGGGVEMVVVAFFQEMTARLVEGLAGVVAREEGVEGDAEDVSTRDWAVRREEHDGSEDGEEAVDSEDGEGDEGHLETVAVGAEDLTRLGLDCWSVSDKAFVEEAMQLWFGRWADVKTSGVECCGVRVV